MVQKCTYYSVHSEKVPCDGLAGGGDMLVCDGVAELLTALVIEARFDDLDADVGATVGVIDVRGTRLDITGPPRQAARASSLIVSVSSSIKLKKQSCSSSQLGASA